MQNFTTNPSPICNIALIAKNDYLKSVTLNALANYLNYSSSVQIKEFTNLVPVNVNFFDREKCENVSIPFGGNSERTSITTLKCHLLLHHKRVYRIIEMAEHESELTAIHKHCETLHGILYLITSEHIQVNIDFLMNKFKPILADLTKSALKNVTFCFTFNHHPNYVIKELKQIIDRELAPFNIQLRDGQNCFHIDCEPFVLLLASESHRFKFMAKDKKLWEKSHENVRTILSTISRNKPHSLDEYLIVKDSKIFFECIVKSVTNLEMRINCKQDEIETEAKRLKSFNNKNRNLDSYRHILNEIKIQSDQINDCLQEKVAIEIGTNEFIQFIFSKLHHQDAKELITPFILKFLSHDSLDMLEIKKIKTETNAIEAPPNENSQNWQNLQKFINSIEINKKIKPDEIFRSLTKLTLLNISGKYLNQNFAYFEAKQSSNPSLKPILELIEPIVKYLKSIKESENVLTKLIEEIGKADKNKIRLTCSVHFNCHFCAESLSCYQECGCKESEIVLNSKGHSSLQKCKTIDSSSKLCTKCNCPREQHIHWKPKDLKDSLAIRSDEFAIVQVVSAQFDYLLLKYSQKCLNDYIDQYLSKKQENNSEIEMGNDETLNKLKNGHWENVLPLFWMKTKIDLTAIPELCNRLFQLKLAGNYFKNFKNNNLTNANTSAVQPNVPTCSTNRE